MITPLHKNKLLFTGIKMIRYRHILFFLIGFLSSEVLGAEDDALPASFTMADVRRCQKSFEPFPDGSKCYRNYRFSVEGPNDLYYEAHLMIPWENTRGGIVWLHNGNWVTEDTTRNCLHFVSKGFAVFCPSLLSISLGGGGPEGTSFDRSISVAEHGVNLLRGCPALSREPKPIYLVGEDRGGDIVDSYARTAAIPPVDGFVIIDGSWSIVGRGGYAEGVPILIVHGRQDSVTPIEHVRRQLHSMPPRTQLVELDCGRGGLSRRAVTHHHVPILDHCVVQAVEGGFRPLATCSKDSTVIICQTASQNPYSWATYISWHWLPAFIRRRLSWITEYPAGKAIPWAHYEGFVHRRIRTASVTFGHSDPSVRDHALQTIEDWVGAREEEQPGGGDECAREGIARRPGRRVQFAVDSSGEPK